MSKFLCEKSDGKIMVDKVFKAAVAAKEDALKYGDEVVDATLGTLFDENSNFVAFDSVWEAFEDIDNVQKAKYAASIQGNPDYNAAVYKWLFESIDEEMNCEIIATPGGAGAISSTLKNILNPGETAIKPNLGWGPYKTMAAEFDILLRDYNMFKDNKFDIQSYKDSCNIVMAEQGKVLTIINDPCHNPTGYTLTSDEWDELLSFTNELSKRGPVIILNDIAYVDYNMQGNDWKKHFKKFNNLAKNVMVVIAFSCSKTLTAYGARVGAQVAISQDSEQLEAFKNASIYSARSIWSTVNNGAMKLFSTVTTDEVLLKRFMEEKQRYVTLLKDRSDIFLKEAKEIDLPIYPYKEGFFITIKIEDNLEKVRIYDALQKNHIFTVQVDGGLRVAICSVPKRKLLGLASKINELI